MSQFSTRRQGAFMLVYLWFYTALIAYKKKSKKVKNLKLFEDFPK